jgi:hypothetical protein
MALIILSITKESTPILGIFTFNSVYAAESGRKLMKDRKARGGALCGQFQRRISINKFALSSLEVRAENHKSS